MERKKLISVVVGGGLVLAAVFGAVATYRVVTAQAATPTPGAPSAQAGSTQPGPGRGMRGGYTEQQLATALGVSLDKLQAAEKTATSDALKQAVADGTITQSQADQFAQGSASGHPFGGMPFLRDSKIDYNALLAKALGISTDQLTSAQQKAAFAAIDQAVTAGTMTQTQADAEKARYQLSNSTKFQDALTSAYQAAVKQAVTDGLITQAQADALLSQTNGKPNWGMGGFGGFGGHGGRGGPGGFGRPDFNGGTAPSNPPTSSPTASPTTGAGA